MPLTPKTIPGDDGELVHYYIGGRMEPSAPLLVFVHGLGSNHTRWHRLVRQPFFEHQCRVIVVDLRGHGASHARRGVNAGTIGRDIARLLEHEAARRAILIGHCLGANLAAHVWERCPERIGGLVLIEPFVVSMLRWPLRAAYTVSLPVLWLVFGLARVVNTLGIKRRRFRMVDFEAYDEWVRPRLTSFWAAARYMGPWLDLQTMPVVSYLQAFRMLFDYRPPWGAIACPALAIYGKRAELAGEGGPPPSLGNDRIRAVCLDASHFVLTDNMPGVASAIETFVGTVREKWV